jgi:hypothetical protein
MGVMVGSSFGLDTLPRSQLITLFAIVGLAAGCVGLISTPSSQFRRAPDSSFQRLSSSMGRWIRAYLASHQMFVVRSAVSFR